MALAPDVSSSTDPHKIEKPGEHIHAPGLQGFVFALFLIFCRIGTCLMLMPGFSSSRIPAQVRLFLSFAITLALSPIIAP